MLVDAGDSVYEVCYAYEAVWSYDVFYYEVEVVDEAGDGAS